MEPSRIKAAEESLRTWCERNDFRGWDPWDALASPLLQKFPFTLRLPRWGANHLIKISPLNPRVLLHIPRDCFAKGLGLLISGYVLRQRRQPEARNLEIIRTLQQRLKDKIIPGYSGPCWGTNVAYQTRAFFVPAQTPSLVHTAFVVEALLDLYDLSPHPELLETARGACRFILEDLTSRPENDGLCFSYTPKDQTRVVNVTALAARMLARTGKIAGDANLLHQADLAARWVVSTQAVDGSWVYGLDSLHGWIDNYHTGFVLDALDDYGRYAGNDGIESALLRGREFYRHQLFLEDGTPKFSPHSIWPVDGHCLAQGILTFSRSRKLHPEDFAFASKIAVWGIKNMQHPSGYFYFQKRRRWTNRLAHIRWVQAWMFLALNKLLFELRES
jgi:hypothetical protein